MIDTTARRTFSDDHAAFRDAVRKFLDKEVYPNLDRWEQQRITDREFWRKCGDAGMLCPTVPEEYGGAGLDYSYNALIQEELAYTGANVGISLQSDIVAEYLVSYGSPEQKRRWLPPMVSGEVITALAMTEPGAGSDLQGIRTSAVREGDSYVINGSKTYITNGENADLIIVVAKTDPAAPGAKGVSLLLVDARSDGFRRGRTLDKIGLHSSDTAELFFDNVRIATTDLLGEENRGFAYMMQQLPQERLTVAVTAHGSSQRAFDEAVKFTRDRKAFGKTVLDFQNTRFVLADLKAKLQVGAAHLDWAIERHVRGELTAPEACATKLWHTELQWDVVDAALQLHGGAGYMNEYPIARLWRDARVQRIYGGTSEIMKEVIARAI